MLGDSRVAMASHLAQVSRGSDRIQEQECVNSDSFRRTNLFSCYFLSRMIELPQKQDTGLHHRLAQVGLGSDRFVES